MNQAGSSGDWRQGVEGGADGKHSWRRPQRLDGPMRPRRSRWVRLFGSTLGLALTLFLIWLVFNFMGRSQVGVATVVVSGYRHPDMPPVGFADRDARTFLSLKGRSFFQVVDSRQANSSGSLKSYQYDDTLIVYLNGQCGLDPEKKELFLLSQDAQPDTTSLTEAKPGSKAVVVETGRSGRVALSWLWKELRELPRQQKKLVLLDLCRGSPDWRLGTLPIVVDDLVKQQLAKEKVPNLVVILSDRVSMHSGSSPHLGDDGQSAFAYFAAQGLAGNADASDDQRISVLELFSYLQDNVRHWSMICRDSDHPQVPIIFPDPKTLTDPKNETLNFTLAACRIDPNKKKTGQKFDLDDLTKLYLRRDALFERKAWQRAPLEWTRIQGWMRRAEQCAIASQGQQYATVLGKIKELLERVEQMDRSPTELLPTQGRSYVDRVFAQQLASHYEKAPAPAPDTSSSREDLETPSEMFLLFNGIWTDIQAQKSPISPSQVHQLRQRADQAFSLKLGVDPWIIEDRKLADQGLRMVEDLALAHAESGQINPEIQETISILERVEATAKDVEAAHSALNEALMILPSVTQWVAFRQRSGAAPSLLEERIRELKDHTRILGSPEDLITGEFDRGYQKLPEDSLDRVEPQLLELYITVRDLQQLLVKPSGAKVDPEQIKKIQKLSSNLQGRLRLEANKLVNRPPTKSQLSYLREVEEMLLLDIIPGADRIGLLKQYFQIEKVLAESIKPQAPNRLTAEKLDPRKQAEDFQRTASDCAWQTFWMIQHASLVQPDFRTLGWCKRWARDIMAEDKSELQIISSHQLSQDIAASWEIARKSMEEDLNTQGVDYLSHWASLRRADMSSRVLPAYDTARTLLNYRLATTPTGRLESIDLLKRLTDLSQRCVEDYWASADTMSGEEWYETSSEVLGTSAGEMLRRFPNASWGERELSEMKQRREAVKNAILTPGVAPGSSGEVSFEFANEHRLGLSVQREKTMPEGIAACWLKHPPRGKEPGPIVQITPPVAQTPTNTSQSDLKFSLVKPSNGLDSPLVLTPEVRFRGHLWSSVTPVNVPSVEQNGQKWEYRNSNQRSSITVDGESQRKILFVLDCSQSMKEKFPNGDQKFEQAVKVLKNIIGRLTDEVSGELEETDEVGVAIFGNQKVAFKTDDNRDVDFQVLVPIERNDVDHQNLCKDRLDKLVPEGVHTIALGAMRQGAETLDKKSPEPGVLVLITDGAAQDNDEDAWKDLARKLGKNQVFIVAYALAPEEMKKIQDETNTYNDTHENDIRFLEAPEPEALTRSIKEALEPREYFVLSGNERREARLREEVDNLVPGNYRVEFDGQEFEIQLHPGQHANLNVTWNEKQFKYERVVDHRHSERVGIGEPPPGDKPGVPSWAAVTEFVRDDRKRARLTVAFEHGLSDKAVLAPREYLFAVSSDGKPVTANAFIEPAHKYTPASGDNRCQVAAPASSTPAYFIEFDQWDSEAGAEVSVAWKMEDTNPSVTIPLEDLLGKQQVIKSCLGEKVELEVSAVRRDRTLEISLKRKDKEKGPSISANASSFPINGTMTRVQLGIVTSQGQFVAESNLDREIEVFESGRIDARFTQNDGIPDLKEKVIAITLPESLLEGALQTTTPIQAATWDQR